MKNKFKSSILLNGFLTMSAGLSLLRADTITWDAANNNWTSTTLGGQAWADYDSAVFGTAGSHAIAVGPNVFVGKPTGANGVAIDITSGNYTFDGSSLTFRNADAVGGGDMDVRVANDATATFNTQLTSANNGGNMRLITLGNDAIVNLNGGLSATHTVSLGNFNTGTINLGVGALANSVYSANTLISSSNTNVGNATLNVNKLLLYKNYFTVNDSNAVVNFTSTDVNTIQGGQSNELDSRVRIQNGEVNVTGGIVITSANRNGSDTGTLNGAGRLEVSGGTLDVGGDIALVRAEKANAIGNGSYIQTGGVVTARGIISGSVNGANVANGAGSVGNIDISGGSLYIGTTGIQKNAAGPDTVTMSFSGGIIGAYEDWSSNLDMTLSNTATFKAADEADAAHNITLNGVLSGSGELNKTGAGSLTLNASVSNTYNGGTLISAGTLVAATQGSLGVGNVTVELAALTLENADTIAETAILYFEAGSTIHLDFMGADALAGITNTTTLDSITAGTYTFTELNDFFGGSVFTGTGSLTVIPEPSVWLLGISSLGAFCLFRRRKS